MKIANATALVTGATGGIGQAIARELATRGSSVVLTGRRAELLEPLAAEFGARAVVADLLDRKAIAGLIDEVGSVDILVANAGLPANGLLTDFSDDALDRAIEVNLRSPIMLARKLAEGMISRRRGHLVFMSSMAGKVASAGSSVYNATKFGLRGLSLALREELRPHGVGVSAIYPGFIREAGMFAEAGVALPPGVGTNTPADVARAVAEAIERNTAETNVAPLALRIGAVFSALAPGLGARIQRTAGGERLLLAVAENQRDKR